MKQPFIPLVRAAIIGISGYGRIHLELIREFAERVQLIAAVVINADEEPERVAALKAAGCRIYADYEEMLAKESGRVELCFIPTGIAWHARMTIAALYAGMNVLVEKPLAASVHEVRAIIAASVSTGRFVAVGFQDVYSPSVRWLKQQLVAGKIGTLHAVRFAGLWPRSVSYFTRNNWAGRLQANGAPVLDSPLNNAFAHFVNLVLFFAGPTLTTSARAQRVEGALWRTNAIESFDSAVVHAVSAEGVALWFGCSHACAVTLDPEIIIEGNRGRSIWRFQQECRLEREGLPVARIEVATAAAERSTMMGAVLDRMAVPETFICTPQIVLSHTEFIEQLHAGNEIFPASFPTHSSVTPTGVVQWGQGIAEYILEAYGKHAAKHPPG